MTIAVTLQAGTTFARTATVAMPNYPSPPAGGWRLDFSAQAGATPVLSFSSADGSIGVNAHDSSAQTVSLVFLAAAQDSLNIPAGTYSGYLVYADGNGAEQAGDNFVLTVTAAANGVTLPPAPSYSDIASWGPLTDIAGTPTATSLQMLPRGLSGPTGPAPWSAPAAWAPYTAYVVGPPASAATYGSSIFVCKVAHTSGAVFDSSKWQELTPGLAAAVQAANGAATAANGAATAANSAATTATTALNAIGAPLSNMATMRQVMAWLAASTTSGGPDIYVIDTAINADIADPITIEWRRGALMRSGDALYQFIATKLGFSGAQMSAAFAAMQGLAP
jgi:hypothetical protein